jgi:hypothetical protein
MTAKNAANWDRGDRFVMLSRQNHSQTVYWAHPLLLRFDVDWDSESRANRATTAAQRRRG